MRAPVSYNLRSWLGFIARGRTLRLPSISGYLSTSRPMSGLRNRGKPNGMVYGKLKQGAHSTVIIMGHKDR